MSQKVVSLLIPTRSDNTIIDGLIESAIKNAYSLDNIEIIVSLSETDSIDRWFADKVKIVRNNKEKGRYGFHEYINSMAQQATGGLLWVLCDDFRIKTKNYDLILSGLQSFFSRVYRFMPEGGNISGNTCPLFTRRWYQVTNRLAGWWVADCWTMKIAEGLPLDRKDNFVPIVIDDITLEQNLSQEQYSQQRPDKDFNGEASLAIPYEAVEVEVKKDINFLLADIRSNIWT